MSAKGQPCKRAFIRTTVSCLLVFPLFWPHLYTKLIFFPYFGTFHPPDSSSLHGRFYYSDLNQNDTSWENSSLAVLMEAASHQVTPPYFFNLLWIKACKLHVARDLLCFFLLLYAQDPEDWLAWPLSRSWANVYTIMWQQHSLKCSYSLMYWLWYYQNTLHLLEYKFPSIRLLLSLAARTTPGT